MLEIRHLTKIYTGKGGAETKALDDVSVSFGETGLVFLLGKSGSGKSTLLNLSGGLDAPTSGEIVVMGMSSGDFSGADFDSYRNTFVGFIFQEYNVLDEFTVEDNIALALELQGKPKNKEKIASILRDVELENFAKRKPNTLSGGQKQRIAIARALVKDPRIIMADEPTGALDSATGKQVFETLKKLSETRLVLVVSHDREFAEVYGDRIIELKDGKIVSDVTKEHIAAEDVTENVRRIGEDTITVRGGAPDGKTLCEIETFLKESGGEVLISRGQSDIASFRRANRISEDGSREKFIETKEVETKEYDGKKIKFIRSRLPAAKALKIGASGLRLKPFRLVMTVLLSLVSFVMFGLFSTMMFYDGNAVLEESLLSGDDSYIAVRKNYTVHAHNDYIGDYTYVKSAGFTPQNVAYFGEGAFGCRSVGGIASNLSLNSLYYSNSITRLAVLPEGNALRTALGDKYPSGANEIAVSTYFLESAKNGTFYARGENGKFGDRTEIGSESDLIGKEICFLGEPLRITGIFDSGTIPPNYDGLKQNNNGHPSGMSFQAYMDGSIHRIAFVSESFAEAHKEMLGSDPAESEYTEYFDFCQTYYQVRIGQDVLYGVDSCKVYDPGGELQLPILSPASFGALADDELIVSPYLWFDCANAALQAEYGELQANPPAGSGGEDASAELGVRTELLRRAQEILLNRQIFDETAGSYRGPTAAETEEAKTSVLGYMEKYPLSAELWRSGTAMAGTYKILGFYLLPAGGDYSADGFYCSRNFYDNAGVYTKPREYTNYKPEPDAMYDTVFVPHEKTRDSVRALIAKTDVNDPATDIVYSLDNITYSGVQTANSLVEDLSAVFLWIGVILAVFAALLLFNFISMSIANKKKEIGILRAVGARGMDVFRIFFAESGIIVGICTVLAIICTLSLSAFLNNTLKAEAGLTVSLFVFGPLPIAVMAAVALAVALVSTFLPVYFAARKKPVESIRAL